jgi:TRAP-type mannitol/chloroaromatic compound transport system permease small subunit
MKKILSFIDALSVWTGKASSWLVFIVVVFILYEVSMRYILHKPTLWVTESVVFGCGIAYVLGGGLGAARESACQDRHDL